MSLENAINKLTQVIKAVKVSRNTNTTPIEYGPDGRMRPLYNPAMSPVKADHPICNTSYAKGTREYCFCTQFAAGTKCCYKAGNECRCMVNNSTDSQPANYKDEQYDCAGFEIGISYY